MKKNIIISILALMLAISAVGCGQKDDGGSALTGSGTTSTASKNTDEAPESTPKGSVQEQLDSFAENADKKINMDKIEGSEYKTDNSGKKGDGKMTTCKVSIDEVKLAEIEGSNVLFVQFDFKNTTDSELNFSGEVLADAYQDGLELSPAVFPNEIEGFSPTSTAQKVAGGDSIKVQKAYVVNDPNTAVEIYVRDTYDETGKTYLSQVFVLND